MAALAAVGETLHKEEEEEEWEEEGLNDLGNPRRCLLSAVPEESDGKEEVSLVRHELASSSPLSASTLASSRSSSSSSSSSVVSSILEGEIGEVVSVIAESETGLRHEGYHQEEGDEDEEEIMTIPEEIEGEEEEGEEHLLRAG